MNACMYICMKHDARSQTTHQDVCRNQTKHSIQIGLVDALCISNTSIASMKHNKKLPVALVCLTYSLKAPHTAAFAGYTDLVCSCVCPNKKKYYTASALAALFPLQCDQLLPPSSSRRHHLRGVWGELVLFDLLPRRLAPLDFAGEIAPSM